MKIKNIFKDIKHEIIKGSLETEISDLSIDSREIKNNMMFVAIIGADADGHADDEAA